METSFKTNLRLLSLKNSSPNWSIPGTEEWQTLVNKCISSIKDRCEKAAERGLFQLQFSFYEIYVQHLKVGQYGKFSNSLLTNKLFEDFKRGFKIGTGLEIELDEAARMYFISWKDEATEAD